MIRFIIFLLILAAISLGVNWLLDNDGAVGVSWMGYRLETSVSVIVMASCVALVMGILILQLFIWLITLPTRLSYRRNVGNINRGITSLTQGFAYVAAGDFKSARKSAKRSKQYLGHEQPLALILEAQAAQMDGDKIRAEKNYNILLENKETKLIGLKGLLGEAKKSGDNKRALELAEEAYKGSRDSENVIPVLLDLYKREGKWEKALTLIESGKGKKIFSRISGSSFNIKKEKSVLNFMYARSLFEADELDKSLILAEKAYNLNTKFIPAAILIVQVSVKLDRFRKAGNTIRKIWKDSPRPQLSDMFFHIYANDSAKKQLSRAEKLASLNADNMESHILVARAAINADDATKARNHLKMAMANGDTARACSLMAKVEEVDEEGSTTTANEWLDKSHTAIPDPVWMCKSCRSTSDKWQLVCNNCSSVDSFSWEDYVSSSDKIVLTGS